MLERYLNFLYDSAAVSSTEMNTCVKQTSCPQEFAVTGVDIVMNVIKIAAGQELTVTQEDIVIKGYD